MRDCEQVLNNPRQHVLNLAQVYNSNNVEKKHKPTCAAPRRREAYQLSTVNDH